MITNTLICFLQDDNVSVAKKYEFLKKLNLCYSDIFSLMQRFKYNNELYPMLHSLISYCDNNMEHEIKKQEEKRKRAIKQRKIKQIRRVKSYD